MNAVILDISQHLKRMSKLSLCANGTRKLICLQSCDVDSAFLNWKVTNRGRIWGFILAKSSLILVAFVMQVYKGFLIFCT